MELNNTTNDALLTKSTASSSNKIAIFLGFLNIVTVCLVKGNYKPQTE